MSNDEDKREMQLAIDKNLRAAAISVAMMAVLIVFDFFCAISPYNLELVGIILSPVFIFIYIKFAMVCTELNDLGGKRKWVSFCKIICPVAFAISALLCMLGIG